MSGWKNVGTVIRPCNICGVTDECKMFQKLKETCRVCLHCEEKFVLDGAFL